MEKVKIERKPCSICGVVHTEDELFEFAGKQLCINCLERETVLCSHCGERIWFTDNSGTVSMPLCRACYDEHYTSCTECGRIIHRDDARYKDLGDEPLCYCCYEDTRDKLLQKNKKH